MYWVTMTSSSPKLTTEEQEIKDQYIEKTGHWPDGFDEWLALDADSFEVYGDFAEHTYETGNISEKEKALLRVAITASPTHMYEEGTRLHISNAFDKGANVEEIKEVLELVSILGLHSTTEGMPYIVDEFGVPEVDDSSVQEEKDEVRELFKESRGYWNEFWDGILQMDHKFLEKYTFLSGYPWNHGTLDPKLKEFIYIAIDVSTTHLYSLGMEQHLENAIDYGATREELVELIEFVSEQGYDAMDETMPILYEEAEKRGKL